MLAATYAQTGPASEVLKIVNRPTPEPGPGEVRVRLHWSGVNPSDTKSRAGTRSPTMPFPEVVPHSDGAGVIDAVGAGVPEGRIGQRVWVFNAAWGRPMGTAAQWVTLPGEFAIELPQGVELIVGALLGIPAQTAYHAVHLASGVAGKVVLVAGGAGAVGQYAVQMAKTAGASTVIATVSSDAKADVARLAGADVCINYREANVETEIRRLTHGRMIDRIIEVDFGANAALDLAVLAHGGDIVVYGSGAPDCPVPFVPAILQHATLRFFIVYNLSQEDRARAIHGLTEALANGSLRHNIGAELPLERIAEAHQLVEGGATIGNVVIDLRERC